MRTQPCAGNWLNVQYFNQKKRRTLEESEWLERYRQLAAVLEQLVDQQAQLIKQQRTLLAEQRELLQRLFGRLD